MDKNYLDKIDNFFYNHRAFDDDSFGCFSKMYSMTTENLYGFLKNIDLKDKKVLTVNGSGDQLLNAYLLGAKDVTCFDINPNSFCNTKLKIAAIKNLCFNDFLSFFNVHKFGSFSMYGSLDYRLFEKLVPHLDKDTINLYSLFYQKIGGNIFNSIYHNYYDSLNKLSKISGYMNQKSYNELVNKLDSVELKFIESNIVSLKDKLKDEKFDIILLSNISDYIVELFDTNALVKFRSLTDSLMENLNDNGLIQVGYIYSSEFSHEPDINVFRNDFMRDEIFTYDLFKSMEVDSYDSCGNPLLVKDYDRVITRSKR